MNYYEGGKDLVFVHRTELFLFLEHRAQLKLFPVQYAHTLFSVHTVQSVSSFTCSVHHAEQKLFLVQCAQTPNYPPSFLCSHDPFGVPFVKVLVHSIALERLFK